MKQSLCGLLVLLCLVTSVSAAQSVRLQGNLHRGSAPNHGTYNLTTGFELGTSTDRSGPATIFDNTDGISYYYSLMEPTWEWIDSFAFPATEISGQEQINGFQFEYCSQVLDLTGDAITAEVRFYEEFIPGSIGVVGWSNPVNGTIQNSACTYLLSGLPGNTGGGFATCWETEVDLMHGFECSLPQEITPGGLTDFNGVGWMYYDASGSELTGPALGSNYTSAGPGSAQMGYGSENGFQWYDLSFVGSENFGYWFFGCTKACGWFPLILFGDGILDTDVVNADIPNTGDVLCLGSDLEFRTGNVVTWALDDLGGTAVFPSAAYAMLVGTAGSSAGFGSIAGAGTTLLVDPGSLLFPPTPFIMSGAVPSVTTPTLPGLPPTIWAQSLGFNGGVGPGNAAEASNALRSNN